MTSNVNFIRGCALKVSLLQQIQALLWKREFVTKPPLGRLRVKYENKIELAQEKMQGRILMLEALNFLVTLLH